MDKILQLINVDKLDESKQTEIKEQLESIIDIKVNEKVNVELAEKEVVLKEELTTTYEEKFEEYKEDITEKFSNFIDDILEKEIVLDEKVIEFARKGELYSDLIDQFKSKLAIDEGQIDEEVKEMLREARDEIVAIKQQLDTETGKTLTLESEYNKVNSKLYLHEKVKGLPIDKAEKVMSLLEDEMDTDLIDKKFETITKTILSEDTKTEDTKLDEDTKTEDTKLDEDTKTEDKSGLMEMWVKTMNKETI